MVNLSRITLRGVAAVGALAGFAALALPNAQAAQTSSTTTTAAAQAAETPKPIQIGTGLVAGPPPAGDALSTKSSLTNVVRYNKLYKTGAIPTSKCHELNVSLRTFAGVVAYENNLYKCLYGSWALPLKQAGAAYKVAPKLVVHNSSAVNSKCGVVTGGTAFFCGVDNGYIYIPAYVIINYWKQSPTMARAYATFTLSHEYGHHVQWLTGILNASWARQNAFSTYAAQLEESRRRELQASCLGGAVDGANKRNYPFSGGFMTQYNWVISNSGDQPGGVRDHGAIKNHAFWVTAGFNARHSYTVAGNCNTFNASSAYVA
ncbi:neutral zinc metallopeptidase [Kribbella kalugense]|uniref:Putative neutral zinc metallopeptidase n=1 Tax=Kribbella kalugense TaxID=2512221 RepID=A0A4R7ZDI4_9ACTN|nr:neutral zinc metallopeptidase [Kribbella kalugense]TDW15282.1 putative neutral zinc metallopeptidase [Kribbella kalugense]